MMSEGADNLPARGIAVRVENTITAVRPFTSEQKFRTLAVKCCSPANELLNRAWSFFDQGLYRFNVTEAITSGNRILLVQFQFVVVAQSYGNAALSIL